MIHGYGYLNLVGIPLSLLGCRLLWGINFVLAYHSWGKYVIRISSNRFYQTNTLIVLVNSQYWPFLVEWQTETYIVENWFSKRVLLISLGNADSFFQGLILYTWGITYYETLDNYNSQSRLIILFTSTSHYGPKVKNLIQNLSESGEV